MLWVPGEFYSRKGNIRCGDGSLLFKLEGFYEKTFLRDRGEMRAEGWALVLEKKSRRKDWRMEG